MTLGEKLSHYRRAKGFTQDQVAEQLGVTPQAVSKWENDASCPDIMLLAPIADLYGVTVDELLNRESSPVAAMVPKEQQKAPEDLVLRVLVDSTSGDKVRVNLPMVLVKVMLEGVGNANSFNVGGMDLSHIDWKQITELAERGAMGRLVEVDSADGDHVIIEVV